MKKILALIMLSIGINTMVQCQPDPWTTWYERSGGLETPRYDETVAYCRQLAEASPWLRFTDFGISPQGRPLPLLIADREGAFGPENKTGDKAVILIQACIHPGESEGKDAGMMLLRDIAIRKDLTHLLDSATILFIPIFNVDGHERFGPFNRINQNGPKEMGWRTTANNLNLNRDYLKADSPEMQAWLTLFNAWQPDFFIDCHTTDGADYQYVLTYEMEIYGIMEPGITDWQRSVFIPEVERKMEAAGLPIFPYISFRNWFDPESGITRHNPPPMLSHGYSALRNRPGLLIETHMLKPYRPRVEATYAMLVSSLEVVSRDCRRLKQLVKEADELTASRAFRASEMAVDWGVDYSDSTWVDFLGIGWEAVPSDLTGGTWFKYNQGPRNLKMKLFEKPRINASVRLPEAYIIPPEWTEVIERLAWHGVKMFRIDKEVELEVETYRFSDYSWDRSPYEGRLRMRLKAEPFRTTSVYPAGSLVVPMDQAAARIVAWALEPEADGSFVKWGFFNAIFEQKEYGETYVMEKKAREMIASNPALLSDFEQARASDPGLARSQWAQLNWFYTRTEYRDQKKDIYPVGRLLEPGTVSRLTGL